MSDGYISHEGSVVPGAQHWTQGQAPNQVISSKHTSSGQADCFIGGTTNVSALWGETSHQDPILMAPDLWLISHTSPHKHLLRDSGGQSLPSLMASAVVREHTGRQDTAGIGTGWSQLGPDVWRGKCQGSAKALSGRRSYSQSWLPGLHSSPCQLLARGSSVMCHCLTLSGWEWGDLGHSGSQLSLHYG